MLDRFRDRLRASGIAEVDTTQADVFRLDALPQSWKGYDLVVSASMLEYVPRGRLAAAITGLRDLLAPGGRFVLFITRRNLLTRVVMGAHRGSVHAG